MGMEKKNSISKTEVEILPDGRMTSESCAAYTGFSMSTLAHYRISGKGPPFVRIEGKVFYKQKEVDRWLAKK